MTYPDLKNKIIVVTGAAQGIGFAYSQRLIKEGATVVAVDLVVENVEQAVTKLNGEDGPGKAVAYGVDVSSEVSCTKFAADLQDKFGRVDGLINNAAIFSTITMKPFWEITEKDWDQVMAVNLKGPWTMIKTLLPLLQASSSASIVNIGSDAVQMGRQGYAHYVASKGGVTGMTFSLSHELGEFDIRINTLSPGPVYTEVKRGTVTEEQTNAMKAAQALHRTAGPDDMTSLATFLLSDESNYITGQTISVNGGLIHR